jgi:hypothetical protein
VLDSLSSRDNGGIANIGVVDLVNQITAFLNNALYSFAFFAFWVFASCLEDLIESRGLRFG